MKNLLKPLFLTIVALVTLIFVRCQEEKKGYSMQEEAEIHIPTPIDTSAMDEEFYKRMWEFEALHPSSTSDK